MNFAERNDRPSLVRVRVPWTRLSEDRVRRLWLEPRSEVLFLVPDLTPARCANLADSVPSDCRASFLRYPLKSNDTTKDTLLHFFRGCLRRLRARDLPGAHPVHAAKITGAIVFSEGCFENGWSVRCGTYLRSLCRKTGARMEVVKFPRGNRSLKERKNRPIPGREATRNANRRGVLGDIFQGTVQKTTRVRVRIRITTKTSRTPTVEN